MAKLFSQGSTTNFSAFYNFLENNKDGTFLENAEIALSKSGAANDTLTIKLNNSEVTLRNQTDYGAVAAFSLKGKYSTFSRNCPSANGNSAPYWTTVTGAMLGRNGLLLKYFNNNSNTRYSVALTADSTGELAAIVYAGSIGENSTHRSYQVAAYNNTSAPDVFAYPAFSASQTSLAQVVPQCDDPSTAMPYCFAALHTQVAGEGFTQIIMGGKTYITNGYWYIEE